MNSPARPRSGNVGNAVATRQSSAPATTDGRAAVLDLIGRNRNAIALSLPSTFNADRFQRLLITAGNTNPELFTCTASSFLAAGVFCAQLGLEPNDARGLAYLIPFKDHRKGKIVQVVIGYRGMMELARRSGMVSTFQATPVFSGDEFHYQLGLDPQLHHVPNEDGDDSYDSLTHVYAVARVRTPGQQGAGDPQFVVLTRRQIDKVRNTAKAKTSEAAFRYSPWFTEAVEMAKKTALRRLCKYLPQTVEMAAAATIDDAGAAPVNVGDLMSIPIERDDDDPIDVSELAETTGQPDESGESHATMLDGEPEA